MIAVRRWVRALIGLAPAATLLATALLLAAPSPASAHATLLETDPGEGEVLEVAPAEITFTFDEPVQLPGPTVRLFDATGDELASEARVSDRTLTVVPGDQLDDGTFVVSWRVISADGHPIAGALTFSVGAPSERVVDPEVGTTASVDTDLGLVQGLTYVGVLGAVGLALAVAFLVPAVPMAVRVLRALGILGVLGSVLLVPLGSLYQQGRGIAGLTEADVWTDSLTRTPWIAAAMTIGGLVICATVPGRRGPAAVGGALALAALPLVGHPRGFEPTALLIPTDFVHVVAGAVWFGGLLGLVLAWRHIGSAEDRARAVSRFSAWAAATVAVVALTGTLLGWRIVGSVDALTGTTYGRLLIVKVTLVGGVLLVAAWNRWRLVPRLRRTPEHDRWLARTIRFEAVALVGVLAITGFLVERSPVPEATAPVAADTGGSYAGSQDGVSAHVVVEPGTIGTNEIQLYVHDELGVPIEPIDPPRMSVQLDDLDLGQQNLAKTAPGSYAGEIVFPKAGTWRALISVRISEFESPIVEIEIPIG